MIARGQTTKSKELYKKACEYFPGGVNSPVRAFGSVEGTPIFIDRAKGAEITDVDGNTYIDFCLSWGPLILGHANDDVVSAVKETAEKGMSFGAPTALENQLASLILDNHHYMESLRFVNSGTEATMSAIRLARGITGRDKIIKFEGCYHGHADHLLVKAGSGLATLGTSSSAGVPESFAKETIVIPLNDEKAVDEVFAQYAGEIACIILEPVPANNGLLIQRKEWLTHLRKKCDESCALLIFDEVISGFRLGFEGASAYYGIKPDLITFGKIIGGGMPVGAYGGSKKFMAHIAPLGAVYQAGTLSGNPVAMAAGIAQLKIVLEKGFYENLENKTKTLAEGINAYAKKMAYDYKMVQMGSIFWSQFMDSKQSIRQASQIKPSVAKPFDVFFNYLLENGIYIGPSAYEVGFLSSAHSDQQLAYALKIMCQALDKVYSA